MGTLDDGMSARGRGAGGARTVVVPSAEGAAWFVERRMTRPDVPRTGGCRCGAVRFASTPPPVMTMARHCTGCRRMSGGGVSTPITVPTPGLAVTDGRPAIRGLHGAQVRHHHRDPCKGRVFTRIAPDRGFVNVRATMPDERRAGSSGPGPPRRCDGRRSRRGIAFPRHLCERPRRAPAQAGAHARSACLPYFREVPGFPPVEGQSDMSTRRHVGSHTRRQGQAGTDGSGSSGGVSSI